MTEPRIQGEPSLGVRVPGLEVAAQAAVLDAYDAHHDEVWAFLLDATHDGGVAEDLLQETYLRLLREARAGRMPEQVRPWLYRVATNLVLSRGRRLVSARRWFDRAVGRAAEDDVMHDSPERRFLRHEATEDLDRVLAHLGRDARAALLLSAEGFSGREIAAAIGRSEVATRTLLCRARMRARQELARTGGAT